MRDSTPKVVFFFRLLHVYLSDQPEVVSNHPFELSETVWKEEYYRK
jgi:hypothetical protein